MSAATGVARLMRNLNLEARRRTTVPGDLDERPADLVDRNFRAPGTEPACGQSHPDQHLVWVRLPGPHDRPLQPLGRGLAGAHGREKTPARCRWPKMSSSSPLPAAPTPAFCV